MPAASLHRTQDLLTERLRTHLPGAQVELTTLPDVPELRLFLLGGDFCSATLGAEEIQAAMDYPAYWAFCWASGQVLARYVLDNPDLVRGRTVLDFGCGSGVAGIAAALAGASRVIACDLDPDALLAAHENARLNGVELQPVSDFWQGEGQAELILAADILYDRGNMDWPARFLRHTGMALLADSRIRNFHEPGYRNVSMGMSCTWPDLNEMDEFRRVNLYLGMS